MTTQTAATQPKPEAWREDPDMLAAPIALLRAAQKAKLLAERTGTPYVVRERGQSMAEISPTQKQQATGHTG